MTVLVPCHLPIFMVRPRKSVTRHTKTALDHGVNHIDSMCMETGSSRLLGILGVSRHAKGQDVPYRNKAGIKRDKDTGRRYLIIALPTKPN